MARNFKDMDQILKFILNDSDADVDLGEDDEDNSDIDSEWEYEEESCVPEIDEFEPRREDRSEARLLCIGDIIRDIFA